MSWTPRVAEEGSVSEAGGSGCWVGRQGGGGWLQDEAEEGGMSQIL